VRMDQLRADSLRVDSLRSTADMMQRRADSLYENWDMMWKQSDSLRIESMLLRMESNQLKSAGTKLRSAANKLEAELKEARRMEEERRRLPSDDDTSDLEAVVTSDIETVVTNDEEADPIDTLIEQATEREASIRESVRVARAGKLKKGQTEADSATAWTMEEEPEVGTASYYAEAFHGKKTSSGEKYNMKDLTCAHRWLPYGTIVEVTNLHNGKKVRVRVNDRGPFKHGRIIDLSKAAATELDMIRRGTARVQLVVVEGG